MKISDIAKKAKVSKSAVSIALNNKPGISDKTRERIMNIVRQTGYKHRSMVDTTQFTTTAKTIRLLTCVKPDIISQQFNTTSFFAELIQSLEQNCRKAGYSLIFSSVDINGLKTNLETLEKEHSSGGIVLLGTNLTVDEIKCISEVHPNLVVLDTYYEFTDINFVVMDNVMGGYNAASYLANLGHGNIGYVQSSYRLANFKARKRGFMAGLEHNGIGVSEKNFFSVSSDIDSAKQQFSNILKKLECPLPEALFCECDYIAIGVIKSLYESGIRVPGQVSVMGFDNVRESRVISPELTTISVSKEKMGEVALQRLLDIIENHNTSKIKSILDTNLVVRNSCRKIK